MIGGSTNPCGTNPCQNGGTCSSESGKAVCKCIAGWTGTTCQNQGNYPLILESLSKIRESLSQDTKNDNPGY